MNKEKFIELFEETLEMEEEVKLEDKFRDYEEWDSLSVLSIMATINEEFDVVIPRKIFDKMETINDIFIFLNKKE